MGHVKGVRKSKRAAGIRVGGHVVPAQIAISALLALIYLVLLAGSTVQPGTDALLLRATSFAAFALLAYAVRAGLRRQMGIYARLIDAFLALSAAALLWDVAAFLGFRPALATGMARPLAVGLGSLAIALALIAALLYVEKDRPAGIGLQAGDLGNGLNYSVPVLLCGAAVSVLAVSYLDEASPAAIVALLATAVAVAAAVELWFRGVLLSRLLPVAGVAAGFAIQAIVAGAFEASVVYAMTSSATYALAVLAISAVLGLIWAWSVRKTNSIIPAAVSHAGVAAVLLLPAFFSIGL